MVAAEYGWTIDQFLDLTGRQLQVILESIGVRRHNDFGLQSTLHGHRFEQIHISEARAMDMSLTEEEQAAIDAKLKGFMNGS